MPGRHRQRRRRPRRLPRGSGLRERLPRDVRRPRLRRWPRQRRRRLHRRPRRSGLPRSAVDAREPPVPGWRQQRRPDGDRLRRRRLGRKPHRRGRPAVHGGVAQQGGQAPLRSRLGARRRDGASRRAALESEASGGLRGAAGERPRARRESLSRALGRGGGASFDTPGPPTVYTHKPAPGVSACRDRLSDSVRWLSRGCVRRDDVSRLRAALPPALRVGGGAPRAGRLGAPAHAP